ncbi:hypothetical protein NP603_21555, partial [Methylomonas sp. SURF-1]
SWVGGDGLAGPVVLGGWQIGGFDLESLNRKSLKKVVDMVSDCCRICRLNRARCSGSLTN